MLVQQRHLLNNLKQYFLDLLEFHTLLHVLYLFGATGVKLSPVLQNNLARFQKLF